MGKASGRYSAARWLRMAGPVFLGSWLGAQPAPQPGPGPVSSLTEQALASLRGSSITLGGGYIQGTFKAGKAGTTQGNTQLTDNGQFNFLLDYTGKEKALLQVPMKVGSFLVGWNITATAGQFQANKQLLNSAISGTDVGTSVKGQYAAVAPSLFMRMGPLYPGQEIYWSFGVSAGGGAARYQGDAQFSGNPGVDQAVGAKGGLRPTLYETAFWRLDVGHWVLVFNGKYFLIRDPNLAAASYEIYGLSLGYRITF